MVIVSSSVKSLQKPTKKKCVAGQASGAQASKSGKVSGGVANHGKFSRPQTRQIAIGAPSIVGSGRGKVKTTRNNTLPLPSPKAGLLSNGPRIHAQRKFAQGASTQISTSSGGVTTLQLTGYSPTVTPTKDSTKFKQKRVLTPISPPLKRPKTEDFLTFLCFRGTPSLPRELDYFNFSQPLQVVDELHVQTKRVKAESTSVSVGCTTAESNNLQNALPSANAHPSLHSNSNSGTGSGGGTAVVSSNKSGSKLVSGQKRTNGTSTAMVGVEILKKKINGLSNTNRGTVAKKTVSPEQISRKIPIGRRAPAPQISPSASRINEQDAKFAMTALKLKYQEKRLANARPAKSLITMLTKKVKERSMVLTRSRAKTAVGPLKTSPIQRKLNKPIIRPAITPLPRNAPSPDIILGVASSPVKPVVSKRHSSGSDTDEESTAEESKKDSSSEKSDSSSSSSESEEESKEPTTRSLRSGKELVATKSAKPRQTSQSKQSSSSLKKKSGVPSKRMGTRATHRHTKSPLRELPMWNVNAKKKKILAKYKKNSKAKAQAAQAMKNKTGGKILSPQSPIKGHLTRSALRRSSSIRKEAGRPSRKTKETAAIYLGLINKGFSSDDEESSEESDREEKESSSGDSSSSETKFLEKQYNASLKRASTPERKKKEGRRSPSPASTRLRSKRSLKGGDKTEKKGKSDKSDKKDKPMPRVLRSQSNGSVESSRSRVDSAVERRKLLMMTCGKNTAGAARKSAKIISRGRRGSRQYSSSSEEEDDEEGSSGDDDGMDVDEDEEDERETVSEPPSDEDEEEEEKPVTRSRSMTNSPMSIPSSRGSKAKSRRVTELIEEEKGGSRDRRRSSVGSSRSSLCSSPADNKSVKSERSRSSSSSKRKVVEKETETEEDEDNEDTDGNLEDDDEEIEEIGDVACEEEEKSEDEDVKMEDEGTHATCSPARSQSSVHESAEEEELLSLTEGDEEEENDDDDLDSPEPVEKVSIAIQVDMDLDEEEDRKREETEKKKKEEEAERLEKEAEAKAKVEAEADAEEDGDAEEDAEIDEDTEADSPEDLNEIDEAESCQSARTKGITLPLSTEQKAQLQEAQDEDDEIQEIGQVINNPSTIHRNKPRRSSPSPPIIQEEPASQGPRITHIHPTPPHPQPHTSIPTHPQQIPPLTIPPPMPPLTSRTSSLTYTSHHINLGASSVPFVPYATSRPSDFFPHAPLHFPTAHLVNSVHLVGSSTTGPMDFASELTSPLSTLSIPVSVPTLPGFPNPLLPPPPPICLGPGGAATMTATSLQTHIRTVATNLDIPLVRPVVGSAADATAMSFSAMGMTAQGPQLGSIPLLGHPSAATANLLTRPPMGGWSQASVAAHHHAQAAAAAAASEARNHFSAFRLPTMTPTSVPHQMGQKQEPLLRPTTALPVSIVQPRTHLHSHLNLGSSHHHLHNVRDSHKHSSHHSSFLPTSAAPSTSRGYNPETIIRNLPNVSIVPKFDRSSAKAQLPSQNPKTSSSSSHSSHSSKHKHGNGSSSAKPEESKKPGKKKSKPATLPAPSSPLTVRKDSNPATYQGSSSKLKKRLDIDEGEKRPDESTPRPSSSHQNDSSCASEATPSSSKFDKLPNPLVVIKQERIDVDSPPLSTSSRGSDSACKEKEKEKKKPVILLQRIKQEKCSSPSPSISSQSPATVRSQSKTPDRPSSSSSANSGGGSSKKKSGSGAGATKKSASGSADASKNGLLEAPTYYPSEQEFEDPLKYFDKIQPEAEKFGMARIVPPRSFRPECNVNDDMRFTAYNHYIHKMYKRWGPTVKETEAIKEHLKRSDMDVSTVPVIGGMEIDFSSLYQIVQSLGGLTEVIEKEKWADVADRMHIPKGTHDRATKLDAVYVKYILPYEMLSGDERKHLKKQVEEKWTKRQQKLQERMEEDSEDETSDEDSMDELDDCVIKGKGTPLHAYYRTARNTVGMVFPNGKEPPLTELEEEYWKIVREGKKHLCVYSGSIDCTGVGWGFPAPKASSKHPWNLKVLANNSGSVLRSMGPVMGATVPTLHVSMLFTSYCWYRDPHGLPWVEYLHSGASKIWYSVAAMHEAVLRGALSKLMPLQCKNKTVWLPSDSVMVPPELLLQCNVPLVRAVQNPGEFLVVFPKSYTSAICAGYLVSESVCFAPPVWLKSCMELFKDIRDSKEPPVFPIEKLLLSIIRDNKASSTVVKLAMPLVQKVITEELALRKKLTSLGVSQGGGKPTNKNNSGKGMPKKKKAPAAEEEVEQCYFCNYILHMSLVRNERTDFVTCLPHAIQHLSRHKAQIKKCVLVYEDTQEELESLLQTAKQRANS